jgi:hypothetical protein
VALKLMSDMSAAWAAVILTAGGGLLTTAIHYGAVNAQISALAQKQAETDARVTKHDDQLAEIKAQNAAAAQALKDIQAAVHDIQSTVHEHDDHRGH